ncbi:MAG: hypothetical protein R3B09_24910 [Nannocystaceae bacterium]
MRFALPAALLTLAALACGHKPSAVEKKDDPARLSRDADALCTAISDGDADLWQQPFYLSTTYTFMVDRARKGDRNAVCEAGEVTLARWKSTRTCTERLLQGFLETKGCTHRRG